jgi:lysozyme family protein
VAPQYSEFFLHASGETLENEGVFSNEKWDPGKETKFGITKKTLIEYQIGYGLLQDRQIEDLTKDEAIEIYHRLFWLAPKLDRIPNRWIAAETFDAGVNCGKYTGVLFLQRALNFLRPETVAFIDEDGDLGYLETLPLLKLILNKYGPVPILRAQNGEQYAHYKGIKNPDLLRHAAVGWMKRLDTQEDEIPKWV